jgi:hypothetical protein
MLHQIENVLFEVFHINHVNIQISKKKIQKEILRQDYCLKI